MEHKKIQIKITDDGKIFAETLGLKGNECVEYIQLLEVLLDAETVDSNYTEEYYETSIQTEVQGKRFLKED